MPGTERRFRKATIKDVARRAGVSTTTVSVFVSGRETVCSPETAERIRAAVTDLNYTPSSLISAAQTSVTRTIGVCMPNPLDPVVFYGNLFFERLWRGIMYQADLEDYSLLHYPASIREASHEQVDRLLDGRVDGILFHSHENARPARIAAAGMPSVLLTRSLHLPEGIGTVFADEAFVVGQALNYLWERGHRRIAHLAGPVGAKTPAPQQGSGYIAEDDVAVRRLQAYQQWMRDRDAYDPSLVFYANTWRISAIEPLVTTLKQLPDPPTAVQCANDELAMALIAGVQEIGWEVPRDLSVVGIDNSTDCLKITPTLTSVDIRLEEIGRESVRCLLRLMTGRPIEECRVALPAAELVERESVAEPGK